jgi:hypothetical protein
MRMLKFTGEGTMKFSADLFIGDAGARDNATASLWYFAPPPVPFKMAGTMRMTAMAVMRSHFFVGGLWRRNNSKIRSDRTERHPVKA